jgi:hypothetical protein
MRSSRSRAPMGLTLALGSLMAIAACSDSPAEPEVDPPDIQFSASGEGCTVAFWRAEENLHHWPEARQPSRSGGDFFPGLTHIDILWLDGDGLNALGRQTVASLLSADHAGIDFGITSAQVGSAFRKAAGAGEYEGLRNLLEALNQRDCPIGG